MTTADRIKYLREKLGLTQEQLASRMGYTGKSSISKIETSGDNVTLKKISKLAPILHTSEAYLMGWVDNPDPLYMKTSEGRLAELQHLPLENVQVFDISDINMSFERTYNNVNEAFFETLSEEEQNKIIHLYQLYQNADPVLQKVVEKILKDSQQESEHRET